MKNNTEHIIELVRLVPQLILTGSRYFGTETSASDWDFMLSTENESLLPAGFTEVFSAYHEDPYIERVYTSAEYGVHIQMVYPEYLPLRIRAGVILRDTSALKGLSKMEAKNVWAAVIAALNSPIPAPTKYFEYGDCFDMESKYICGLFDMESKYICEG